MFKRLAELEFTFLHKISQKAHIILKYSFAIIFMWYGTLKVLGTSPVQALVENSTSWLGIANFSFYLGIWEIILGFCFLFRGTVKIGIIMLFMQFPGTFFPLFFDPQDCFTSIPFGLTIQGQYIFKNIILISSALIILGETLKKKD